MATGFVAARQARQQGQPPIPLRFLRRRRALPVTPHFAAAAIVRMIDVRFAFVRAREGAREGHRHSRHERGCGNDLYPPAARRPAVVARGDDRRRGADAVARADDRRGRRPYPRRARALHRGEPAARAGGPRRHPLGSSPARHRFQYQLHRRRARQSDRRLRAGRLLRRASRGGGEGRLRQDDRLAGADLLHQRLLDPRREHLGGSSRRADAGELHRGGAGHAAVRAMARSEAVRRSALGPLRAAFGRLRSFSSARAAAHFSTPPGAGHRSPASTFPTAARPTRWRRRACASR